MAPADLEGRYLSFGSFRLDCRTGELHKRGRGIKLQAQPAKLLVLLASRPGEIVTRTEIRQALWGDDTFVDFEQGINFSIRRIREALGDDAENPRYVETVPRAGYRFIASTTPVERVQEEPERSPYPGLMSFSSKDAEFFFGREEEVETLWTKLERRHLLALIGPSGGGKSSLLHAGLVPGRPSEWGALICRPRDSPFATLEQALRLELELDQEPGEPLALLRKWRRAYREALLCIDAFEELFTLNDEDTRSRFCELLRKAVDEGVHVLLAMRDDFFVYCHDYPGLGAVFDEVTPLKTPQGPALRRALVEPARRCGFRFEDEALVADILAEVTNEKGALSLLAFAAARLWQKRDRRLCLLTRQAYLEIGGVVGALSQHAEATLAAIGQEREPAVREIIRNLTTARGTRAAQDRDELLSVFEEPEEASAVLQKLIDSRLLISTGHRVELVHESLLSGWPRLVRWQAQDAEGAVLRDQLRHAAQAWQERGSPEDLLWTGAAYRELALWRDRYPGGLTATEQAFFDASRRHAERARRRRRIAMGSLVAAAVAVAAITSSLWRQAKAEALRAEASKLLALAELRLQDDPTEALAFATSSLELADTGEARVFVMKALWEAPPAFELIGGSQAVRVPEFSPDGKWIATAGHATDALVWSEGGAGPIVLPGHAPSPRGPNRARWASPNLLVTGSASMVGNRVHLWSFPDGNLVRSIEFGERSSWQVGHDLLLAETLVSGTADTRGTGVLRSWSLPDGKPVVLGEVDWKDIGTSRSFFELDGRSWLYAKDDKVYSRPLPAGREPDRVFARLGAKFTSVWHTSDWLAVADKSGVTHVWSATPGAVQPKVIPKPGTASQAMFPDSTGRWLSGDPFADSQLHLWDLNAWNAARPLSLRRRGSWYAALAAFHPTGEWAVASTATMTRLTFWPIGNTYPVTVDGYAGVVRPLAFSPDGKWLATSWPDRRLRLWPLPGSGAPDVRSLEFELPFNVRSFAFDPRNRYLFAVGSSNGAGVFPLDGSPPRILQGIFGDTMLQSAAVSPSGRRVATAFWYGQGEKTLRIWDLETGEFRQFDLAKTESGANGESQDRSGYEQGIFSLAFADDATLYTAGDGGLRRWDLETGSQELIVTSPPNYGMRGSFRTESGIAITIDSRLGQWEDCPRALLHDLAAGTFRQLTEFGECGTWRLGAATLDPSGTVAVTGGLDGTVRVGRLSGNEPHLLVGHKGAVDNVAISGDLRWVATTGQDNTLRLWPMPDLDQPPFQTLPHDQLLAKLRSLTNLRAVRDSSSPTGWEIEVGPFPGWKVVPAWR